MRKWYSPIIAITVVLLFASGSCKLKEKKQVARGIDIHLHGAINQHSHMPFDSNLVISFYRNYPALNKYEKDVMEVYRQHRFNFIWHDEHGIVEFGQTLYGKVKALDAEGISSKFPCMEKIDGIFENGKENTLTPTETELMLTNLYLFYAGNVYKGLDDTTTTALGWLLPRKQVSYGDLLDSVMSDPVLLNRDDSVLFSQYYKLRDALQKYREIEKKGGWNPIGKEMNLPIDECIKKIIVNMERCRWISPEFAKAKEYIVVNVPSFTLNLVRNGKSDFESPVIVGKNTTKTVIFSGMLSYIVFCPYWNLPQSIINKEVKPGMKKNKNYLETHNMEWNNGQVRQKPGKNNSLGLVKFIFPNSNDIYMHDTPAKSLFEKGSRAFSHGCIRVGKPRDLAVEILRDDPNWTPEKIDAAMHAGKENSYSLKKKIPVYIGYLTAWVDAQGRINFYEDIYDWDERLAELLTAEK